MGQADPGQVLKWKTVANENRTNEITYLLCVKSIVTDWQANDPF